MCMVDFVSWEIKVLHKFNDSNQLHQCIRPRRAENALPRGFESRENRGQKAWRNIARRLNDGEKTVTLTFDDIVWSCHKMKLTCLAQQSSLCLEFNQVQLLLWELCRSTLAAIQTHSYNHINPHYCSFVRHFEIDCQLAIYFIVDNYICFLKQFIITTLTLIMDYKDFLYKVLHFG